MPDHASRNDPVERGPERRVKLLVAEDLVEVLAVVVCVRERLPHVQVDEEVRRDLVAVRIRGGAHRGLIYLQIEVPPEQIERRVELDPDQPEALGATGDIRRGTRDARDVRLSGL